MKTQCSQTEIKKNFLKEKDIEKVIKEASFFIVYWYSSKTRVIEQKPWGSEISFWKQLCFLIEHKNSLE